MFFRQLRHRGDVELASQHVGHVRGGHELDPPFAHDRRELVHVDAAVIILEPHVPERRARSLAHELPRHQVGVMLQHAHHDLVAGPEVCHPPGVRHQVDRLRRVAREDDLAIGLCVDELRNLDPRLLVGVGGLAREVVDPAVHVGVAHHVVVAVRVDDRAGLLRGRRAVQVHEALAGLRDVLLEDGEIGAELRGEVDGGGGGGVVAVTATRPAEAVGSRVARGPGASGSGRRGGSRGCVERRAGGE